MKVLMKAVAGSHLFGTNTKSSDVDYKGVFLPSKRDILLCEGNDSFTQTTGSSFSKNTSEDIDIELYSLKKFMKMLEKGDTAAIELLFTPRHLIIESTNEWEYIISHREDLLHKNVQAILGYSRAQANKYGIRGSRMGELGKFLKDIKVLDKKYPNLKMKVAWDEVTNIASEYEHILIETLNVTTGSREVLPSINVLGKKFDHHTRFDYLAKWVSDKYKEFGQRSRDAMNNSGIDYKACSHAVRVTLQAKELLTSGKITLPHSGENLKKIMEIKNGNLDWKLIGEEIESQLDEVELISKTSNLPDNINTFIVNKIIMNLHEKVINE